MIKESVHKYSVSAMRRVLKINRSTYYYETKPQTSDTSVENAVVQIFEDNQQVYGTRKINVELKKLHIVASWRRIGRLQKKNGLVSVYTVA